MKKNISINISGIVFYIEEDTYEELKTYLSSVEQYFASYEDSKEIIEDIETRIAEIFMSTLDNGKQVITQEDVNHLIATMGSVADFQAMEEDPAYQPVTSNPIFSEGGLELQTEAEYKASLKEQPVANPPARKAIAMEKEYAEDFTLNTAASYQNQTAEQMPAYANSQVPRRTRSKRLYRDGNHKLLAGVASGLAHYFNIDVMWVRLMWIVFTFGLFLAPEIPAFTVISYIIMWAVVPINRELEENPQIKKFYRDRKRSTIGGVAAGLSHYLGIELATLRILFVLGMVLGGASLLLYAILWIISPEAKTITDRMRMEGEPITLQNIDSTLRKTVGVPEKGNYRATTKAGQIMMFPFKLAGIFINSISPLMRPFFVLASESIRIGGGFMAFIIGLGMTIALTIGVIFTLGGFHVEGMYLGPVPARFYYDSMDLPALLATSMYFTFLIPSLFIIGLGISLLFRRWVIRSRFGWTMAGLWVVSLIGLGIALPPNINNFGYTNTSGKVEYYSFEGKQPVLLDMNLDNGVRDYRRSTLTLQGYGEKDFKLEYSFGAAGNSYQDAANNAQMISYGVQKIEGNALLFDRNFTFKPNAKFRAQRNYMKLSIPYEKEFVMTNGLRNIIYNTINRNGYSARDMDGKNVWKFKKSGRLVCVSCKHSPDEEKIARYENRQNDYSYDEGRITHESLSQGSGEVKTFTVSNFKQLAIGGVFEVKLVKSNETKVLAKGREADLEKIKVTQNGDKVKVSIRKGSHQNLKNIILEISTPSLENLNVSGACKLTASGFSEAQMNLEVNGASKIELKDGNADMFKLNVSGASKIMAYEFAVKNAQIELSGASKAYVQVANKLSVEASGASKVRYRGNPTLQKSSSGVSSIRKAD